jgi:hypothetical protein
MAVFSIKGVGKIFTGKNMRAKTITTFLGILSIGCSLFFWLTFALARFTVFNSLLSLPMNAYFALWGVAWLLAIVVLVRDASRWWRIAALLPFINFVIAITIVALNEH